MAQYRLTRPMWTGDKTLYRTGTREIPDAHAKELGLLKSADTEESGNGGSDLLAGVRFASAAARTAAEDSGLTAADFAGRKASSTDGFTKPDVMALIESQNDGEEG